MTLRKKLREAEEYGAKAAHVRAERVKSGIQNGEANLRKLHLSRKSRLPEPILAHADPEQESESSLQRGTRTGIVSVNGRDVGEMRCTGGRH